jgi:hypothetical protein
LSCFTGFRPERDNARLDDWRPTRGNLARHASPRGAG